jgi:hypothetical protein
MHWIAIGLALLLAFAIIVIGARYVASPLAAARSFGLPLPEAGANTVWWLRLKGVRDIASGVIVLVFVARGGMQAVGIVLLVEAIVPVGDMLLILAANGSRRSALGIHGVTALVMILTAIALMTGLS